MSNKRTLAQGVSAALILAGLAVASTGTASADPTPGPPPFRTYATVGADTTADVWNALTNPATPAIANVASWNAVPTGSQIQTKAGGATFLRPAGGNDGVRALSAVWDPNYTSHAYPDGAGGTVALTHEEVDFARTTSAPVAGSGLAFLPFDRDAVSVAIKPFESGVTPTGFTTAQLAAIYGGADDNTAGTGVTYNATSGLPKFRNQTLRPILPASTFATRTFFLAAIGISTSDLGSYVEPTPSTLPVNNGTVLTTDGQLIPFSAAQWISQANGASDDTTAGVKLLSINSKAPFVVVQSTGQLKSGPLFGAVSGGKYTTPPSAGVGTFARDTYNVVPTAFFSGTASQQALVAKLTGTAKGNLGNVTAQNIIKKYGFGVLSYLGDPSYYLSGAFQH